MLHALLHQEFQPDLVSVQNFQQGWYRSAENINLDSAENINLDSANAGFKETNRCTAVSATFTLFLPQDMSQHLGSEFDVNNSLETTKFME